MPSLRQKKLSTSAKVFIIAAVALLYCPFFNIKMIGEGYIGDAMIQIKVGLDMIASKGLVLDEIYSWHPGLNWCPEEVGWYFFVGAAYKLFGLIGVIGLTAVFNYTMAGIIFKKNLDDNVNPYILLLTAAAARCMSFPNYNARPHLASLLLTIILLYSMLSDKLTVKKKIIVFCGSNLLLAWFHGGMIPLFFVIYAVFIVIELVYKNYKVAVQYLIGLIPGFIASLLSPIGIETWTFAYLQSQGTEIWANNMEWAPKTFPILEITAILVFFMGFAVDERLRNFDKKVITKLCFYCMFIIISCKYCRFMNFTAMIVLMFCAEELQVLLNWLNDNIFHFDKKKLEFGDISNYILTVFCAGFMIYQSVFSWISYFPTNTLSDISGIAAYDEGVIDLLHEKKYDRIYNSFFTGTWLVYYGIPVHLDNRTDPYMMEFSGVDHIRGKMMIMSLREMDAFVDEYDVDAIVVDMLPGTTDEYFAEDLYASDRYNVIYDNTVYSTYVPDEISHRWIVAEVVS